MDSQGNAPLITTIIFLIALSAGGYWYWQINNADQNTETSATEPTLSPTPTPLLIPTGDSIDTSTWAEYDNPEYGFKVKYPSEWFVITKMSDYTRFALELNNLDSEPTTYLASDEPKQIGIAIGGGKSIIHCPELGLLSTDSPQELTKSQLESDLLTNCLRNGAVRMNKLKFEYIQDFTVVKNSFIQTKSTYYDDSYLYELYLINSKKDYVLFIQVTEEPTQDEILKAILGSIETY